MALVIGTNAGFVTTAPTADPSEPDSAMDTYVRAIKDTSPVGAVKITEIGWYCDNATQAANFEVGIYDHDSGNDKPLNVVGSLYQTNAKGTGSGWKTVTVDIDITAETIYWIAVQLDDTATTTFLNTKAPSGERIYIKSPVTGLADPFPTGTPVAWIDSTYAVWEAEAAVGTNMQINIGDAWKAVPAMKINIGDVWKNVLSAKINIGDAWKTIF